MHKDKLAKGYISDIDKFLMEFDENRPNSESQTKEINKHNRIFQLRDDPNAASPESAIWEDFYK